MPKYRKKPVVIEAMRWEGDAMALCRWFDSFPANGTHVFDFPGNGTCVIPTLEGRMVANKGDYIIRGVKGEFYPCKPEIFEATYKPVVTPKPEYMPRGEQQKLGYLAEECGEVLAALGKTIRWGLDSYNPELPRGQREQNRDWLLRELDDLEEAIRIVREEIDDWQTR